MTAAKHADVVLFAGTSFAVGITDAILAAGVRRRASLFSIDPSGRVPHRFVRPVMAKAEDTLPELVAWLGPSVFNPKPLRG